MNAIKSRNMILRQWSILGIIIFLIGHGSLASAQFLGGDGDGYCSIEYIGPLDSTTGVPSISSWTTVFLCLTIMFLLAWNNFKKRKARLGAESDSRCH